MHKLATIGGPTDIPKLIVGGIEIPVHWSFSATQVLVISQAFSLDVLI